MVCGRPLFPGSTVEEELRLIFKVLGTPTEGVWADVATAYGFQNYEPENLLTRAPRLDPDALDLLNNFLFVSLVEIN